MRWTGSPAEKCACYLIAVRNATPTPPDATPPTGSVQINGGAASTSQPTVTLTLTATDGVGVNGIEYKIGAGAYQKYNAPATVPTASTITWRAVDVNGNIEATHTCSVRYWGWPSGDSDCDGFPDSVMAAGKAVVGQMTVLIRGLAIS